ncbi:MAG: L-aspartate oxidase [Myxococcota bacterium]
MEIRADFLVIGGGIAGLSFALKAASHGSVAVLFKKEAFESNTRYAQGGIAAVWDFEQDSFESHIQDTHVAGAGLCRDDAVQVTVRTAPARIHELIELGVRFSKVEGQGTEYDLGREGGHSERRILHAKDLTGQEILRALLEAAAAHPQIQFYEHRQAVDLVTTQRLGLPGPARVVGAYVLDEQRKCVETFRAPYVMLASGGCGKVYLYTSNPDVATGDGVAMAYRAGAAVANMEFIQFHPTCLFHPHARNFLISEAVRGEGGVLKLRDGSTFMEKYHPLKSLAPRDIVARAIDNELKQRGDDCVYLDITHHEPAYLRDRFPNIYQKCLSLGIDLTREHIPVVPAAHYACGGVKTDLNGQTTILNLYASGEVACTGLHGANRLASNSLLEALVFSHQAIEHIRTHPPVAPLEVDIPPWNDLSAPDSDEMVVVSQNWDEIRRFMWNYVGIVRTTRRLARALKRIELLQQEIKEYYWNFRVTSDVIELRNLATVAELIVRSALLRHESRGLHYTLDYPETRPELASVDTILQRNEVPLLRPLR